MDLDIRLMRYFLVVAEEEHVGRAAERLHISQPALSKQIRRFEDTLGVPLLRRVGRGIALTAAGEQLRDEARRLLPEVEGALERTRGAWHGRSGQVRVAFVAGTAPFASDLLRRSEDEAPAVAVVLTRVAWTEQVSCLHERRADLSFVRLPIDTAGVEHRVIATETRVAGFAVTHPLATRTALSIEELADEPIIDTDNQRDYWAVNPRPGGREPVWGPLANSLEEMLALVSAGRCMCITAASVARTYPAPGISYVPITDIAPSEVALAWRRGDLSPAARHVASLVGVSAGGRRSGSAASPRS